MIRLQDIADMAGVSRTTVSNVINGKTKRVSQATIDKVTRLLKEQEYIPNMGSVMLSGQGSKIIGVVLGYAQAHGRYTLQDSFVGEFLSIVHEEAERQGYFVMLIGGENCENIVNIASRWDVEGLIILGFTEERYHELHRKLNKKMVLVDTYPEGEYTFQNVGIDDFSGGFQVGEYLLSCGFRKALFVAETTIASDYSRWMGFKAGMEKHGDYCSKSRYVLVSGEALRRKKEYGELLPRFLKAQALAFSSDYVAVEVLNFLCDHGIDVPGQISLVGFDDSAYARFVRPQLTTVHQDIPLKAKTALFRLMKMIRGEPLEEMNIKNPVSLVKRDSVKE